MRWQIDLARLPHRDHVRLGYALAPAAVGLATAAIALIRALSPIPNLSMLYLLPILALAGLIGRRPALLAAVLAFLAYDFFFVDPVYTFTVRDPEEWLALLVFLFTAIFGGQLAAALRDRAEEARRREADNDALYTSLNRALEERAAEAQRREHITSTLYELSRALATKQDPDQLLSALTTRVVAVLGVQSCAVVLPDDRGQLQISTAHTSDGRPATPLDRNEAAQVDWLLTHPGEHRLRPSRHRHFLYVPLETGQRQIGLLRVEARSRDTSLTETDAQLLTTFAAQAAVAIEQARLAREEVRAEILTRSDKLKDALLSSVSHDLRTPLASIRAAAGSLLQEDIDWDPETRREFAAAIDEEATRLNRLVGAVLDMSRIEGGALRAQQQPYPLDALIESTVARLRPELAGRDIELQLEKDLAPVPLDPVQIDQVLTNLIENARKYSPAETPLTITLEAQPRARGGPGRVLIGVADRGPGIPPLEQRQIFDKFYRLRKDAYAGGSGLGLAIARGFVEANGGQIWVDNRRGGGAHFTFSLPYEPPSPQQEPQNQPAKRSRSEQDTTTAGELRVAPPPAVNAGIQARKT